MSAQTRVPLVMALAGAAALSVRPVAAAGGSRTTLVVLPARYSVLQVGFDLERRFPIILMTYKGDASTEIPQLNAWTGSRWVPVTLEDYREGGFLQARPAQAVLVGGETLLPPSLAAVESWCPKVSRVPTLDTATLVNSFGNLLRFRPADWKWFAARYNLQLQDLNAARRRESWYDQPGPMDEPARTPVVPPPPPRSVLEPVAEVDPSPEPPPAPIAVTEEPSTSPAPTVEEEAAEEQAVEPPIK